MTGLKKQGVDEENAPGSVERVADVSRTLRSASRSGEFAALLGPMTVPAPPPLPEIEIDEDGSDGAEGDLAAPRSPLPTLPEDVDSLPPFSSSVPPSDGHDEGRDTVRAPPPEDELL